MLKRKKKHSLGFLVFEKFQRRFHISGFYSYSNNTQKQFLYGTGKIARMKHSSVMKKSQKIKKKKTLIEIFAVHLRA
jgi:hypothetical protein